MKRITLSLLAFLILAPAAQAQSSLSLEQRVALRRQARLQRVTRTLRVPGARRVQRQIVPAGRSPRRYVRGHREVEPLAVYNASIFIIRYTDGSLRGVRILGIDAPETTECYTLEGQRALASQLLGAQSVSLQKEEGYHYDSYNRMVRYVKVDGRDVGVWLIRNGFAFADRDHEYDKRELYEELEAEAKTDGPDDQGIGLWSGACDYQPAVDLRLGS